MGEALFTGRQRIHQGLLALGDPVGEASGAVSTINQAWELSKEKTSETRGLPTGAT